jgi:hypothetical protein
MADNMYEDNAVETAANSNASIGISNCLWDILWLWNKGKAGIFNGWMNPGMCTMYEKVQLVLFSKPLAVFLWLSIAVGVTFLFISGFGIWGTLDQPTALEVVFWTTIGAFAAGALYGFLCTIWYSRKFRYDADYFKSVAMKFDPNVKGNLRESFAGTQSSRIPLHNGKQYDVMNIETSGVSNSNCEE